MTIAIFRARVRSETLDDYIRLADEVAATARAMPGFISWKVHIAADGERVSVHEWESEEALAAWTDHPLHLKVKEIGRANFYDEFTSCVCSEPQASRYARD